MISGNLKFTNDLDKDFGGMKVKVKLLSRVQLCDPMDCSLPGSSVHGVLQARILEWGAIWWYNTDKNPH